jgi:hypothetical protein
MANPEHVEVVKQGAEAIRKWRETNPHVDLDLRGAKLNKVYLENANLGGAALSNADLSEANLTKALLARAVLHGANLSSANLPLACMSKSHVSGANLSRANLSGADLYEADLSEANLTNAHLGAANLTGAILCKTDLGEANLGEAIFIDANLRRASFKDSTLDRTVFSDVDLSSAKSLDTVKHRGPSSIGIDTLYKSRGKIPEVFLRGCGVPDALIARLPSLMGAEEAIQFYSCFISYSHKDEEFAKRLHSRMRDEHLRVWYAAEDMKGGRKIHEQVAHAIQVYDKLLLVLSETSMQSEWVATEIYHARQREVKEKRQVLFPIRLVPFEAIKAWECFDADTGKDMAREIREHFIPDFSNWKNHDSFEAGFKKLLADLKAESQK